MNAKGLLWCSALATVICATPVFSDTISGSGGAGFQTWAGSNLTENASPYWDNTSMDGLDRNVGFYLVNAPTAPLSNAPGALPYWGNAYNSVLDTGGTADPNFFFQKDATTSTAILQLEVAAFSNVNQFGWYELPVSGTPVLHQLFAGSDSAPTTNNYSPTAQYGFYITTIGGATYYTQSSLNPAGETTHQHFTVFEQSLASGAESYWLGVEDLSVSGLSGNENGMGDYQDMLIRISALPSVPEPSTAMLLLSGSVLLGALGRRRFRRSAARLQHQDRKGKR